MNRRAKFDAASFILGREIRNRTNTQTNSKRHIHTLPIGMCGYYINAQLLDSLWIMAAWTVDNSNISWSQSLLFKTQSSTSFLGTLRFIFIGLCVASLHGWWRVFLRREFWCTRITSLQPRNAPLLDSNIPHNQDLARRSKSSSAY